VTNPFYDPYGNPIQNPRPMPVTVPPRAPVGPAPMVPIPADIVLENAMAKALRTPHVLR
jgi:hypothetical protein